MWSRIRRYLETPPEIVIEWRDPLTPARGWLVLNSLRGGAAGGGTRMRPGLTREEVVYLAKAMEAKFSFSGPPIGGAKSGLAFDPADPRKAGVLERWFCAIRPFLRSCYGTGGDVAVDEQREVEPLCKRAGVEHPQEGILRGHLGLQGPELRRALAALQAGLRAPVEGSRLGVEGRRLTVADLITGYGVARAARRFQESRGEGLQGTRVVVEGFGNVGASCALYLARFGARIVGLVDARADLAAPRGLGAEEVEALVRDQVGRVLPLHALRRTGRGRGAAYRVPAELFVPAAVSGSIHDDRLRQLRKGGVTTLVCGANQPFAETRLGDTRLEEAADRSFHVVPDVVASQGMARAFYLLMTAGARGEVLEVEELFARVGDSVDRAVDAVVGRARPDGTGLLGAALTLALGLDGDPGGSRAA
jgi:glutamate dehydrogenase (NAD(P)+)